MHDLVHLCIFLYCWRCMFRYILIYVIADSNNKNIWSIWYMCIFSSTGKIFLNFHHQYMSDCFPMALPIHYIVRLWIFANRMVSLQLSSVTVVFDSLQPDGLQHTRPPCPSPIPGVHPNPYPLSQWCHPTIISSSVIPFSSCPQSFPASRSFQMSQLFTSGGQSIAVSASTSVLPMNTHNWSPLGWTGWISLQSKGLSRVFSNTTVQNPQFFGAQLSSQSNSHIHT